MSSLSFYGVLTLLLIGVSFYFIRRISAYLAVCALAVVGFGALTYGRPTTGEASEWLVTTLGLMLCVFGLLIVRVMLVRSVSLRLLRSIDEGSAEHMNEDIGGRLADMRRFKLIQLDEGRCVLTPFGRLVGGGVTVFYALFRIAS